MKEAITLGKESEVRRKKRNRKRYDQDSKIVGGRKERTTYDKKMKVIKTKKRGNNL